MNVDYRAGFEAGASLFNPLSPSQTPITLDRNVIRYTTSEGTVISPTVNKHGVLDVFQKGGKKPIIRVYFVDQYTVLLSNAISQYEQEFHYPDIAQFEIYGGSPEVAYAMGFFAGLTSRTFTQV